jgi:hypothetical protein
MDYARCVTTIQSINLETGMSLNICIPTNNQAFYSQASSDRLEMKPHELKNRDKIRAKKKAGNKG